jgi:MoxR-like ATPase
VVIKGASQVNAGKRPDETAPELASVVDPPDWWIYQGSGRPLYDIRLEELLPEPPPWRSFNGGPLSESDTPPEEDDETERRLGHPDLAERIGEPHELDMVNAALYLRRPLLVTGPPGAGKSSLAFRIARELRLGRVIRWHITSQTTLKSGYYNYDAIGRAEAVAIRQAEARWESANSSPPSPESEVTDGELGDFVQLGPLGTAFLPSKLPRVLLIDELDKSEADLPNDLLGIFEEGSFLIQELERVQKRMPTVSVFTDDPGRRVDVHAGRIRCRAFPVVVITSNGERDFPPAFLRRCIRLEIPSPNEKKLAAMAAAQLNKMPKEQRETLIQDFLLQCERTDEIPADRMLDAMYLVTSGAYHGDAESWPRLRDALWRQFRTMV